MRAHRSAAARSCLALAGSAALVVALAACSDGEQEPDGGTSSTTPADGATTSEESATATEDPTDDPTEATTTDQAEDPPSGSTDQTGAIEDVPTADVGICLNAISLLGGSEIPPVDCSQEHDAQVVGVVTLPDGDYPGGDVLVASAADECAASFEEFVGIAVADSELEVDGLPPSEDTWAVGDRDIICLAFYPDLRTTTTSFEGAAI